MTWYPILSTSNISKGSLVQEKYNIVPKHFSLFLILNFLLLSYLPHLFWQPVWVSLFFLAIWTYRLLSAIFNWPLSSRTVRLGLSLVTFVSIFVFWGKPIGLEPGSALLALMLGIKTFEIKSYRDSMITLFLGLFLLFSNVLFSQSLGIGLYLIALIWVFLLALISLHQTRFHLRQIVGQSSLILGHCLPLAIVCFLFFPRLPGNLVGFRDSSGQGITGLSDHISPGSISRLTRSSEVTFRVSFEGDRPKPADMYWRVLVFRDFNGRTWTIGRKSEPGQAPSLRSSQEPVHYTVTMEPTYDRRLAALDMPVSSPEKAELRPGFVLKSKEKIETRKQYSLTSCLEYKTRSPEDVQRTQHLTRDASQNPRTQRLAERIHDHSDSEKEYIANILDYLQEHDFTYSLSPPKLRSKNQIDDFLFRTKNGYCVHYAQAVTWMLRDQDIPARIVAGYQGGQPNDLGDYFIIRQSDAHAWVEACIQGQGWFRVDPTNVLAPGRIEQGIRFMAPEINSPSLFKIKGLGWLGDMWQGMSLGLDAINYNWHQWVVNYTFSKQSRLFQDLNLGNSVWQSLSKAILLILVSLFILLGLIALFLFLPYSQRADPVTKWYLRYLKKLSKSGLSPAGHEGPLDLSKRVSENFPEWRHQIHRLTDLYIRLRYSQTSQGKQDLASFKKAVRAFCPRKNLGKKKRLGHLIRK